MVALIERVCPLQLGVVLLTFSCGIKVKGSFCTAVDACIAPRSKETNDGGVKRNHDYGCGLSIEVACPNG